MIHRLFRREKRLNPSHTPIEPAGFSLGFASNPSMDHALEEILKQANDLSFVADHSIPQTLPHGEQDPGFEPTAITPAKSVFTKKTITKSKTLSGLSNPLKVPSYLQPPATKNFPPPLQSSIPTRVKTSISASPENHTPSSFLIPNTQDLTRSQQTRLSIGKELLKAAASCQMISIQEAHSMGSKLTLPSNGLLIPALAQLLHRSADSIQKTLLQKMNKSVAPVDYFKSLIGNQSVQRYHSLLIPSGIVPVFHRGHSLTILAEHHSLICLAHVLLEEKNISIPWIHCIAVDVQALESLQ